MFLFCFVGHVMLSLVCVEKENKTILGRDAMVCEYVCSHACVVACGNCVVLQWRRWKPNSVVAYGSSGASEG